MAAPAATVARTGATDCIGPDLTLFIREFIAAAAAAGEPCIESNCSSPLSWARSLLPLCQTRCDDGKSSVGPFVAVVGTNGIRIVRPRAVLSQCQNCEEQPGIASTNWSCERYHRLLLSCPPSLSFPTLAEQSCPAFGLKKVSTSGSSPAQSCSIASRSGASIKSECTRPYTTCPRDCHTAAATWSRYFLDSADRTSSTTQMPLASTFEITESTWLRLSSPARVPAVLARSVAFASTLLCLVLAVALRWSDGLVRLHTAAATALVAHVAAADARPQPISQIYRLPSPQQTNLLINLLIK